MLKVRDGQVGNRPSYAAIGVTLASTRDVVGRWARNGGQGAKFWMSVLTNLRNQGVTEEPDPVVRTTPSRWHRGGTGTP